MQIEIIIIGILAGLFAGMFGVGGGIVIIPALVLVLGWDMHLAAGTSLATLLMPVGFLALLQYKRANLLYLKGSAFIALGIIFGNIAGSTIALNVDGTILKQLFGLFLTTLGIKQSQLFAFFRKKNIENNNETQTENSIKLHGIKNYILIAIGIVTGILAGLFGIGGGIIITTVLIGIYKINPKQAVAMSLSAMFLPVGIGGVLLYNEYSYVNIWAAVIMAVGMEIGSAVSAKFAILLNANLLSRLFGLVLIIVGLYFIFQRYIFS